MMRVVFVFAILFAVVEMGGNMKACDHCGSTKFGLIRFRIGTLQFCKKKCKEAWQDRFRSYRRARTRWAAYIARGPSLA
jgi:hypothetical protein